MHAEAQKPLRKKSFIKQSTMEILYETTAKKSPKNKV